MAAKYGNRITVLDGITFASKLEAKRYGELRMLERAGWISDLQLQPKFELIPSQRNADGRAERPVTYVGDFSYIEGGRRVVEDAKGMRTKDYIIKRKLLLRVHGITVREV